MPDANAERPYRPVRVSEHPGPEYRDVRTYSSHQQLAYAAYHADPLHLTLSRRRRRCDVRNLARRLSDGRSTFVYHVSRPNFAAARRYWVIAGYYTGKYAMRAAVWWEPEPATPSQHNAAREFISRIDAVNRSLGSYHAEFAVMTAVHGCRWLRPPPAARDVKQYVDFLARSGTLEAGFHLMDEDPATAMTGLETYARTVGTIRPMPPGMEDWIQAAAVADTVKTLGAL
jgi:hypothetical protein